MTSKNISVMTDQTIDLYEENVRLKTDLEILRRSLWAKSVLAEETIISQREQLLDAFIEIASVGAGLNLPIKFLYLSQSSPGRVIDLARELK